MITPLEAIRAAVGPATHVLYAKGTSIDGTDSTGFSEAERVAREADAVLLFVGEDYDMSGEAKSRSSLALPGAQEALVRMLKATGKPLAVVLFAGRPLSVNWLAENASSIVLAWFPGIAPGDTLEVQVDVTNIADRAGDEVVQLYLRDDVATVTRPLRQLRGFQRIYLQPGQRRTLRFELGSEDLAFYGLDLRPVIEPGTFTVFVGGSSTRLIETRFEVEMK